MLLVGHMKEIKLKSSNTYTRLALFCVTLILVLANTGCSTPGGPKERTGRTVGSVVGNVIGAASGTNYAAARVIGGAVVGSYIGGNVGRSMDNKDRERAYYALQNNRNNHAYQWTNRSSGTRYVITPSRANRQITNRYCREYASESYINGRKEVYYGYACRDRDGYWRDARR